MGWDKCERCAVPVILVEGMGLDGWWEHIGSKSEGVSDVLITHTPGRCMARRYAALERGVGVAPGDGEAGGTGLVEAGQDDLVGSRGEADLGESRAGRGE